MLAPTLATAPPQAVPAPTPPPATPPPATPLAATPWPSPHAGLPALLRRLIAFGVNLLGEAARDPHPATASVSGSKPRLDRVERALNWAVALVQVLTGVRSFAYRTRPAPSPEPTTAPDLNRPERLRPERLRAECFDFGTGADRAMRRAFATQPIGQIVSGICQDLGITEHSELWPAELIALTQTPHAWVQAHHPVQPARRPGPSSPGPSSPGPSRAGPSRAGPSRAARPTPNPGPAPKPASHRHQLLASAAPIALGTRPAKPAPPRWRP